MKHSFILAEGPFSYLLTETLAAQCRSFLLDSGEWEFKTDDPNFEGILNFSAAFLGIFRNKGAPGFYIKAAICRICRDSRTPTLPTPALRALVEIPFGVFAGPVANDEAFMITSMSKKFVGLNLSYSRIQ